MGEDGLKEWANANHLQVRGLYGEHSDSSGAIYDVSNKYRLGYSEVQLVQFVIDGVNKLIEMEVSGWVMECHEHFESLGLYILYYSVFL